MLAHDPHSHRHKGKPINRFNEHMHFQEKFTKEEGVHAYVCMWRVARDKQMSPRACNLCEHGSGPRSTHSNGILSQKVHIYKKKMSQHVLTL